MLARLDRWSRDEGFGADLFFAVGQPVREAHDRYGRTMRDRRGAAPEPVAAETTRGLSTPTPDGFGGWRDTPPPVFKVKLAGPRLHAFDKASGIPNRPLLILLYYCGEHPRQIPLPTMGGSSPFPARPS